MPVDHPFFSEVNKYDMLVQQGIDALDNNCEEGMLKQVVIEMRELLSEAKCSSNLVSNVNVLSNIVILFLSFIGQWRQAE